MSGFSLRHPHSIIVGGLITMLLGLIAFSRMPVDVLMIADPDDINNVP